MRFALRAIESPHPGSRYLCNATYERDMKVIVETRPLDRAHATMVYVRLLRVLVTALPDNTYTMKQFAAMPMPPPQRDYFIRTELARHTNAMHNTTVAQPARAAHTNSYIATIVMHPLRDALQERSLLAKDARMISRTIRAALCEQIQHLELLWNADKTLVEIFRRRCGLGQSESQGWLFDFSIDFI